MIELTRSRPRPALPVGLRVPVLLTVMVVVAIGAPLCLAVGTGSISIPHNDAWSYSAISQNFARTGDIHLLGWNRGALIGQLVLVGPLGRWLALQQLTVACLGVAAVVITYRLVASHAGRSAGVLAAGLVMFFPGYALLATSFMEDVPAYFATVACLALGERAFRLGSQTYLVLALLIGVWGCTVREQVIAAPLAVIAAIAWRERNSRVARWQLGGAAVVLLALFAIFELWRSQLANADLASIQLAAPKAFLLKSFRAYYTLALVVSPAVLAGIRRSSLTRRQWLASGVIGLVECVLIVAYSHARGFLGGNLAAAGPYSVAHNGTHPVLASPVIVFLEILALASGAVLPILVLNGWRRLGPILSIFGVFTIAGTLLEIEVGQSVFDRYLISLVPVVVITVGPFAGSSARLRAVAGTAILAGVSLALAASALALDAAEWRAGQALVRAGVAPADIDAGFAWVGYHATTPADQRRLTTNPSDPFYLALFVHSRDCIAASVSPLPSGRVVRTIRYRTFGVVGTSRLYVTNTGKCAESAALDATIRTLPGS
ncbi:MAG: hypothetical protein QOG22_1546 [Pseudonocardiales bacterium]|nr:hypothetical protein [Pseudonocardiales bacterium]